MYLKKLSLIILITVVAGYGCQDTGTDFQSTDSKYSSTDYVNGEISDSRMKTLVFTGEAEEEVSETVTDTQLKEAAKTSADAIKEKAPRKGLYKSGLYNEPQISTYSISTPSSTIETEHPYSASENSFSVTIESPDERGMALHFTSFNTEENYDIVTIYDENDTMVAMYHGPIGSFWSEYIPGSKVTVKFASDSSNEQYGFKVDKIAYDSSVAVADTTSTSEIDVAYETHHGTSRSPGREYTETVLIEQPGATSLDARFDKLDIDKGCLLSECQVWVKVYDESDTLLHTFKGRKKIENKWLSEIIGSEVSGEKIKLVYEIKTWKLIGWVLNDYGFRINRLKVTGATPELFKNEYPIILLHGIFGWDQVLGFDYFFRVKDHLTRHGYEVYRGEAPAVGGLQARAAAVKNKIDEVLSKSSAKRGTAVTKVNLIAHSMGGLDSRLVLSTNTACTTSSSEPSDALCGYDYGDKVAALFTISTPHHGSPVADIIHGDFPEYLVDALAPIINKVIPLYNKTSPTENDAKEALYHLTSDYTATFNTDHPEPATAGILYRAYAGETNDLLPFKSNSDEVDVPLSVTYYIMKNMGHANDGMVPVESAKWKPAYYNTYNGANLYADHFNEIGQVAGLTDKDFDHLAFYKFLAEELKAAGL